MNSFSPIQSKMFLTKVFIGMGSNLGDREAILRSALHALAEQETSRVLGYSALYETEPVGYRSQPPFLNAVVCVETGHDPERLLDVLLRVEQQHRRERTIRWGPRTLDLDILLYGRHQIQSQRLIIPHPRLFERSFVLVPLLDLANWLCEPVRQTATEALAFLGRDGVVKYKETGWAGRFIDSHLLPQYNIHTCDF